MTNITTYTPPAVVTSVAPVLPATMIISVVAASTAGQTLLAANANRVKLLFRFAKSNVGSVTIAPVTGTEVLASGYDFLGGEAFIEEGGYTSAQLAWKSWGTGSVVIWEWIKI